MGCVSALAMVTPFVVVHRSSPASAAGLGTHGHTLTGACSSTLAAVLVHHRCGVHHCAMRKFKGSARALLKRSVRRTVGTLEAQA